MFTHSHSLSYTEARHKFGEGDATAAVTQFLLVRSFGISLLCATPQGGALPLYGDTVAVGVVFLVELAFVLGFIRLDLLCERNLSKKGCWVFFPHLGFSQDKSLVFFSISCLCCYYSVHDIYVNSNEVKEHY